MMTKQRLYWADSFKGFLIILVVLGHAIQFSMGESCNENHLYNLIYSFHMPAFFAISGWLSAYKRGGGIPGLPKYKDYVLRRSRQLLIPYFIWGMVSFLVSRDYTADNLVSLVLYPDTFFWFLWVLFWICIFSQLCLVFSNKLRFDELWLEVLASLLLIVLMIVFDVRIVGFQFIAYYFLFYTFGILIYRFRFLQVHRLGALLFLGSIWLFFAWFWKMHVLPHWVTSSIHLPPTILQYIYRGVTASLAITVLFGIAPRLFNSRVSKLNKCVSWLGVYSLGIYVVHLLLIKGIIILLRDLPWELPVYALSIMAFVFSLSVSAVIVYIISINRWMSSFFLGKG